MKRTCNTFAWPFSSFDAFAHLFHPTWPRIFYLLDYNIYFFRYANLKIQFLWVFVQMPSWPLTRLRYRPISFWRNTLLCATEQKVFWSRRIRTYYSILNRVTRINCQTDHKCVSPCQVLNICFRKIKWIKR